MTAMTGHEVVEVMKGGVLLGRGILSWPRSERVSDRYGLVNLTTGLDDEDHVSIRQDALAGKPGRLAVLVEETRESRHIGDMFRGIFPSTPSVGEYVELGAGRLFYDDEYQSVGLSPADERDADWLNPQALYRTHEQTVSLYFIPSDTAKEQNP